MIREKYVSIDTETTGLDPTFCQVLEFGAVVEDWTTPILDLPSFHCYVLHDRIVGQPFALQMNATILRKIASIPSQLVQTNNDIVYEGELFCRPRNVGIRFRDWLKEHGIEGTVQPAGKNFAGFDRPFLEALGGFPKFRHRVIDPAMLYWDPTMDTSPPDLTTCLSRAGILNMVLHKAVGDARLVVNLVRAKLCP